MRNVEAVFIIRALTSGGFWALLFLMAMFGCVLRAVKSPNEQIICSGQMEYDLNDTDDLDEVRTSVSPMSLQMPPCDLTGRPVPEPILDKIYRPMRKEKP